MDCPARGLPQSVSWKDALRVAASIKVVAASVDGATSPRTGGCSPRPPLVTPGQCSCCCCCCCSYYVPPANNSSLQEVSSLPRNYVLSEHQSRGVAEQAPTGHAEVFATRAAVGYHVEGHVEGHVGGDCFGNGTARHLRRQRRSLSPSDLPCSELHASCAHARLEDRASGGATCQDLAEGSDEWCPAAEADDREPRGSGLAIEAERDSPNFRLDRRDFRPTFANPQRDSLSNRLASPGLEHSAEPEQRHEASGCLIRISGKQESGGLARMSHKSLDAAGVTIRVAQATLSQPESQGTLPHLKGQRGHPRGPITALLEGGCGGDFRLQLASLVGELLAARFSTRPRSGPDGDGVKRKVSSADMTVDCGVNSGMLSLQRKRTRVVETKAVQ